MNDRDPVTAGSRGGLVPAYGRGAGRPAARRGRSAGTAADRVRAAVLQVQATGSGGTAATAGDLADAIVRCPPPRSPPSARVRPVINATGAVLHTNLGRAPLSARGGRQRSTAAAGYTDVEYDLADRRDGPAAGRGALAALRAALPDAARRAGRQQRRRRAAARRHRAGRRAARCCGQPRRDGRDRRRLPAAGARSPRPGRAIREVGTTNRTTRSPTTPPRRSRRGNRMPAQGAPVSNFTDRPAYTCRSPSVARARRARRAPRRRRRLADCSRSGPRCCPTSPT